MRLESILNRIEKQRSFVYEKTKLIEEEGGPVLEVEIRARANGRPQCSGCGHSASAYDTLPRRRFEFVPLWGMKVYFRYAPRRVECGRCGVKVETVPWAVGKEPLTRSYQLFLARWARRLSWQETAQIFGTNWRNVYHSVQWVVAYGLRHRTMEGIEAIGVDEIQFGRGHQYLTVVYQLDEKVKRLLYVGPRRTVRSLLRFFHELGREGCQRLRFVCSDMWKPYLKVIGKKAPNVLHILDRFHIVANLNKALNQIRAAEARDMREKGFEEVLLKTKYCFLKRKENLTKTQKTRLKDVLRYDLKSVRAYLLKESFQFFWRYKSPFWAAWYLDKWCTRAMRSRLEPIKKFVKSLRKHKPLLLAWFKAKKAFSTGPVEGLNRKINLVTRKSYGFRTYEVLRIALFHTMGELPEPMMTHKFC